MKELLLSDAMIDALASLIIWLVFFLVVYVICRINRLKKDIIENAIEDTKKMKKYAKNMTAMIEKGGIDRNSVRKGFWKFRTLAKNTKSIILVYIFENGADTDMKLVEKLLGDVFEEINIFAKAYNTSTKDEAISTLNLVGKNLDKTVDVLVSVDKKRKEKNIPWWDRSEGIRIFPGSMAALPGGVEKSFGR